MIDVKMIRGRSKPRAQVKVPSSRGSPVPQVPAGEEVLGEEDQHIVGGEFPVSVIPKPARNVSARTTYFNIGDEGATSDAESSDSDGWLVVEHVKENSPIPANLGAPIENLFNFDNCVTTCSGSISNSCFPPPFQAQHDFRRTDQNALQFLGATHVALSDDKLKDENCETWLFIEPNMPISEEEVFGWVTCTRCEEQLPVKGPLDPIFMICPWCCKEHCAQCGECAMPQE